MVKKKLGGGKRYKAVAAAKAEGKPEPEWEGPAPPLHVQKKLARKANFLDKVSRASAGAKLATRAGGVAKAKGKKKQGALPSLSTLSAVLDELGEGAAGGGKGAGQAGRAGTPAGGAKQRGAAVKSAKQRQHILAEESSRLQQVLQHPAYVADPIAAITNHLRHTLPPPPVAGAGKGAARGAAAGKGGAGGKAGKKRGAKGSGSAMEE